MPRPRLAAAGAVLALLAGPLAACSAPAASADGRLDVVVSFYPLQYLAERIGGAHVDVTNLTAPGKEPHELELTPRQVGAVSVAALGIYEKGLQPDVDKAFADNGPRDALDVATVADLTRHLPDAAVDETPEEQAQAEHAQDEHAGHDHGAETGTDPHFWLDPVRYAAVADAVGRALGRVDPAHAAEYARNAAAVRADLAALDAQYRTGLARCARTDVVTSHAAFGYLTSRYGLVQVAVAGLSPEQEPEPKQLARIADFARANHVTTIYTETLASPAIAQTVAAETGATTAVLDPLEGITDESAARDYLGVMRANLATLQKGQSCR